MADAPEDLSPAARRALVEANFALVHALAGKVHASLAPEVELADLVEYGMVGLLEASNRYDPAQGASFVTFAYYRVRGAIYDGLRGMGWMRRHAYARARFEARANAWLGEHPPGSTAEPRPPTRDQAVQGLAHAIQGLAAVYLTSLDAAEDADLADRDTPLAEESLGLAQARALVRRTIKKLPEQERQLLELYYYEDKSLEEVGAALGLSKSWTSRLHARVIDKLHRMLAERLG